MSKYFEYHLKKAPRIKYEVYCIGFLFGISPIIASCFFDYHLFFTSFGLKTADVYLFVGLIFFLLTAMVFACFDDEDQVFRFGKEGVYWKGDAFLGEEALYRPAEKIRRIRFSPTGKLELSDSLGTIHTIEGLKYSELSVKQLAESFPTAWEQDMPSTPFETKNGK